MHSHSGLGDSFVVRPSSVSNPFISCWFYFSHTLSKISNPSPYNPCPMIAPSPSKLSSSRPLSPLLPAPPPPHAYSRSHLQKRTSLVALSSPGLLHNYISFCFCSWWEELFIFPQEVLSLRWENMFPGQVPPERESPAWRKIKFCLWWWHCPL